MCKCLAKKMVVRAQKSTKKHNNKGNRLFRRKA